MCKPDQQHFGCCHGLGCRTDFAMSLKQHLPASAKPRNAKFSKGCHGFALNFQQGVRGSASRFQTGTVYQIHQISDDHFRFRAPVMGCCQSGKAACRVTTHRAVQNCNGICPSGASQHFGNTVHRHAISAHRRGLIQQRQSISNRSFGGAGNGGKGLTFCGDGFLLADRLQMGGQHFAWYAAQIKALTP